MATRHSAEDSTERASEIFSHLAPRLRRYVERRLGRRLRRWIDPDDVVQRTMLEVLPGLPRPLGGLDREQIMRRLTWTARRRLIDLARRQARALGESDQSRPLSYLPSQDPSEGPVTSADARRWVRELVERLPGEYREIVRACALEGLSFVECADLLGLEADTVRKRYHRARQRLAHKIAESGHGVRR